MVLGGETGLSAGPTPTIELSASRHALVAVSRQNVFFSGEIIKEGAFANIGGFGDVLDGGVKISTPGKNF